jgi:hypothetical protein
VRITDILATPPECAKTRKVRDLLLAPAQVRSGAGRLHAHTLRDQRDRKTVAGLSDRQREELIGRLSS